MKDIFSDQQKTRIRCGGCSCGRVRYKIEGDLGALFACHCESCRRHHGHLCAFTRTHISNFVLLNSEGLKWWTQPDGEKRGFCIKCGSSMLAKEAHMPEIMYLSAGSLDDTAGLKLTQHCLVQEKPDYYEITDSLPQLDRHP